MSDLAFTCYQLTHQPQWTRWTKAEIQTLSCHPQAPDSLQVTGCSRINTNLAHHVDLTFILFRGPCASQQLSFVSGTTKFKVLTCSAWQGVFRRYCVIIICLTPDSRGDWLRWQGSTSTTTANHCNQQTKTNIADSEHTANTAYMPDWSALSRGKNNPVLMTTIQS